MNNAIKLSLCLFAFMAFSPCLMAQGEVDLASFNLRRIQTNKKAMLVLGGWATANILAGSVLAGRSEGTRKHFHQMNAYWNTVNLAIAGFGYYQATKEMPTELGLAATVKEQYGIQQALIFNAGLDLAYMASGAYMIERSRRGSRHSERLKGFGQSLILQGGFLFLFDIGVFFIQQSHQPELQQFLGNVSLGPTGIGFRWKI